LRDQIKKPKFHLGGLEVEKLAMRMKEEVPTEEENLGKPACSP
jgi:hypothetical protein